MSQTVITIVYLVSLVGYFYFTSKNTKAKKENTKYLKETIEEFELISKEIEENSKLTKEKIAHQKETIELCERLQDTMNEIKNRTQEFRNNEGKLIFNIDNKEIGEIAMTEARKQTQKRRV